MRAGISGNQVKTTTNCHSSPKKKNFFYSEYIIFTLLLYFTQGCSKQLVVCTNLMAHQQQQTIVDHFFKTFWPIQENLSSKSSNKLNKKKNKMSHTQFILRALSIKKAILY